MNKNESQIREYFDYLTVEDFVDEDLSIEFYRQFKDKINWKVIFEEKYLYYQYDVAMSNEGLPPSLQTGPKLFEEFCKEYNQKFYNQYFKFIL